MASPVDAGRVSTAFAAVDPWSVNLPTGIVAGDLLIMLLRPGGTGQPQNHPTPATGWSSLLADTSDATDEATFVYYKSADGTEGTSLSVDMNTAVKGAAIVWRITGAANPATQPPQASAVTVFTTTASSANPGAISPTGGSKDYLWLSCIGLGGTGVPTSAPITYGTPVTAASTGGSAATNAAVGGASKQYTGPTEDASNWTHPAATVGGCVFTIAIHPVAVSNQTKAVTGLGSAGAFGTVLAKFPPQTVGVRGVTSPYGNEVLSDGTTGYWKMADAASPLADASGGGLSMALAGSGASYQQPGLLAGDRDGATKMTGAGWFQAANNPRFNFGDVFTIEAWIKRNSASDGLSHGIISKLDGAYELRLLSTNQLQLIRAGVASIVVSTATSADTNVHHVVATKNGATVKLYMDGVDVTGTVTNSTCTDSTNALIIGANQGGAQQAHLTFDEVAVYPTALSAARVAAHYTAGTTSQFGTPTAVTFPPQTVGVGGVPPSSVSLAADYSDEVLGDLPVAYWRLGESVGTTAVDQRGVLNGSYISSPLLGQPGALSGSGDFDTSVEFTVDGRHVSVPADTRHQTLSNFTVEAWIYPTAAVTGSADTSIVNHLYVPGNIPCVLSYGTAQGGAASGKRVWGGFFGGSWQFVVDPIDVTLNAWHHYVFTYNGTTARLYRNGVEVISAAKSGWGAAPVSAALFIGRSWSANWAFRGRIDEVALYPVALSPSRIELHYLAGKFGAATSQFGKPVVSVFVAGPPQTVPVQGIDRGGVSATIVNEFIVGDGHLVGGGATGEVLFGVPVAKLILVIQPTGVGSAQSFGTVTTAKGPVARAVTGLGTAQAFGTPTVRTAIVKPAGGVPSAQSFGVPSPKATISRLATGLGSAQSFGTLSTSTQTMRVVTGLGSAQSFGAPTVKTTVTKPAGGVGSAQAFGTLAAFPDLIVAVPGLWPNGFLPSLTGQVTSGDGHVSGGNASAQFGVPTALTLTAGQVLGLGSAQAFGTPIIRTAITRTVVGLGTAQSFGTPTVRTSIVKPAGGVPSAQQFGAISTGGSSAVAVSGKTSSQAFGTVTVKAVVVRAVVGLGSAQAFGAVTFITGGPAPQTKLVGGVNSAQQFGSPISRQGQTVQVPGLPQWVGQPSITGGPISGDGHVVGGKDGLFGFVRTKVAFAVAGIGSAQQFGHVGYWQKIFVGGVPSAQAFGKPKAFVVYVRDSVCTDVVLDESQCITVTAVAPPLPWPVDLEPATAGELVLVGASTSTLDLNPVGCE